MTGKIEWSYECHWLRELFKMQFGGRPPSHYYYLPDQWSCTKDIQGLLFKAIGTERDITSRYSQRQGYRLRNTSLSTINITFSCSASNYYLLWPYIPCLHSTVKADRDHWLFLWAITPSALIPVRQCRESVMKERCLCFDVWFCAQRSSLFSGSVQLTANLSARLMMEFQHSAHKSEPSKFKATTLSMQL